MNKQYKSPEKRGIDEAWRPIRGFEGLYEISENGQVRSLPRTTTRGRILSQQVNNSGYFRVSMTKGGKGYYAYVHHLVADAFVGVRPEGYDINHIDGNKLNNHVANLEYVTRKENMTHARATGLYDNRGSLHYNTTLTEEDVQNILLGHSLCGGAEESDVALNFGINIRTVKDILAGKTWRHVDE